MVTARTRQGSSCLGGLLVAVLTALLFAAFHCSSYPHGDGLGHTSSTVSAGHEEPAHSEHGSTCATPALTPYQGAARTHAGPEPALPVADAVSASEAGPATPPRAGPAPIARSGRSTLTSVCRWRI